MKYLRAVDDVMRQQYFEKSKEKTAKQDQEGDRSVASDSSGNEVM